MQKTSTNPQYTYLSLPEIFYSKEKPSVFKEAKILFWNENLGNSIKDSKEFITNVLEQNFNANIFSQAYAGHQFGHFTKLGDGRAIILGEFITNEQQLIDFQLKGSGRTLYSRGGDGKATLRAMLREYLISEAMFFLNIPTSRSLAVISTGEKVIREKIHQGAAVIRTMKSHVRVGTFEYAAYFGTLEDLKALTNYTIKRLYLEVLQEENYVLSFFKKVMENQIDLIVNWMRVGFIHGVMNTDNTSISGETFDYGPCAFMNIFHPDTVFSSIDHQGRYSFTNQGKIIKWNLARFAETLIPLVHEEKKIAIDILVVELEAFDSIWHRKYNEVMLQKIGLEYNSENQKLWEELLTIMEKYKFDYTNTFLFLTHSISTDNKFFTNPEFNQWKQKWEKIISETARMETAKKTMQQYNPVVIPRNYLVEQALDEAEKGNFNFFEKLLEVVRNPYQRHEEKYFNSVEIEDYQTFCGT